MIIYRAIWLTFFTLGGAALVGFINAFDAWAVATAFPGADQYCRGTLAGHIPVTRAPLCLAVWFTGAKAWIGYVQDMVVYAGHSLYVAEVLRTADVGLFAIGSLAGGLALNWLWATAMAQVSLATIAGSYSLMHGLAHVFGGRTA